MVGTTLTVFFTLSTGNGCSILGSVDSYGHLIVSKLDGSSDGRESLHLDSGIFLNTASESPSICSI